MKVTVDCPWCDGEAALHDDHDALVCEACGIVADLAPERREVLAAAA